jgi:hypothetical protein
MQSLWTVVVVIVAGSIIFVVSVVALAFSGARVSYDDEFANE